MQARFELLFLLGCAAATPDKPTVLGEALPMPLAHNEPLPSIIKGRVAVVDLWATWCEPCKATIPKLVRLDRSSDELVVVGVDVGESPDEAARYAENAGITYPIYVDPEFRFSDSLEAREVPTLLIFDKQGRIVARARELDRELLALLRKLMEEK
jgi:thiol-disulfide isomerase/thioredoxin